MMYLRDLTARNSVFGPFMTSFVVITGKFAFAFACEWETVDISVLGHFWPPVTGMICVRYEEQCMYNMFGVLFVASGTSFGRKRGSGVHFGLGENRDSGRNHRLSRFWATSGHLSPG